MDQLRLEGLQLSLTTHGCTIMRTTSKVRRFEFSNFQHVFMSSFLYHTFIGTCTKEKHCTKMYSICNKNLCTCKQELVLGAKSCDPGERFWVYFTS